MLRRARTLFAGVADFVDSAYLRGVRPRVPGGGWTIPMLQVKSIADLQQLWFMLLRERNMLHSMRDHYMRHMEELGAFPAPSRLTFVENSMKNIRKVMQERDYEAVDAAEATFQDRIRKGVYRYPPGPQPPSTTLTDALSVARVTFSSRVEEARLRELLGRYDVFEGHRGIASLTMQPTSDTLAKKEAAEEAFEQWYLAQRDYEEYRSVSDAPSLYDSPDVEVELAPGVFVDDELRAGALPVPPPKVAPSPGNNPLDRIRAANRSSLEKQVLQLGYYPNLTAEPKTEPGPRPVHPDEIEGPWECIIVYGQPGGAEYLKSLNLTRIDGSDVLGIEDVTEQHVAELSLGAQTEEYTEVLAKEEAEAEDLKQWPISPEWKPSYNAWAALPPGEIIRFNYSNVVDYADREALLTGKSILEPPIKIDPTCGRSHIIPPHAKPPKNFLPDKPMAREEY